MLRTTIALFVCSSVVVAQGRDDQYVPERPRQFNGGVVLNQVREGSVLDRAIVFDRPISAGINIPEPPDEAIIDLEAWLREPIPQEEIAQRRAGFRRPIRGTVWRENVTLPDEELLRRDAIRLQPAIDRMQGIWRVQTMVVDGYVLTPEEFAGLKYLFQDTVLFQSEISEEWTRPAPVNAITGQPATAVRLPGMEPGVEGAIVTVPETPERLGPAGTSRPAGATPRYDPRQEEGVRLQMLYEGENQAAVYWWDRDGEVVDPHESRNRPSLRVSWPARGGIELSEGKLTFHARGLGLRAVLPTKFHERFNRLRLPPDEARTTLEGERTLLVVMVRDEAIQNPMKVNGANGNGLGEGEPGARRNIIPQMRRVPLAGQ